MAGEAEIKERMKRALTIADEVFGEIRFNSNALDKTLVALVIFDELERAENPSGKWGPG